MSKLKNNIDNLSSDTENILKDYLKLLKIFQIEKLAVFFGILASVFFLAILLLIVVVIGSVALSGYLNDLLDSEYLGFWIIAGLYIILIVILVTLMLRSKNPLFTSLFVKLFSFVMDVDIRQQGNLKGLAAEKETIREKLQSDKEKLKTDIQLLRYTFLESLFKEFLGLFVGKRKSASGAASGKGKASDTGKASGARKRSGGRKKAGTRKKAGPEEDSGPEEGSGPEESSSP